jgi:hypothetical protein
MRPRIEARGHAEGRHDRQSEATGLCLEELGKAHEAYTRAMGALASKRGRKREQGKGNLNLNNCHFKKKCVYYHVEALEMALDAKLATHINKHIQKLKGELSKETDAAKKAEIENEIKRLEADKLK